MQRFYLIALGILLFLVCSEKLGFPKEIGEQLDLTPTFVVQEIYDSNIFKLRDEERARALFNDNQMDEFITAYSAGLKLEYPIGNQRFTINGKKDFVYYAHYQDQDYENEVLSGRAEFNLGGGFFIKPAYAYSNRSIPRLYNIDRKEQDFLERKDARINAGYQASRWRLSLALERADSDYRLRTGLDGKVETYGGSFSIIPSSTNQWYLRLTRRELKFTTTALGFDNQVQDILLGTSFIFSGKNRLQLEGGQRRKTFSYAKGRDFEGFIGNLSLSHQISRDTTLSLTLSRSTETSYFTNTTYHVTNSIQTGLSCQISTHLSTNLSASQSWIDYKGISGTSLFQWQRYLTLGWGLSYLPHENISCSLSYEFQQRDSNRESWEFKANQVVAGLHLSWK